MYFSCYDAETVRFGRADTAGAAVLDEPDLEHALYTAGIATCAVDEEWTMTDSEAWRSTSSGAVTGGLPDTLLKAYNEVCAVIDKLRDGRDVLHKTTVSRLHTTTAKLAEVSSTTEQAATGILDSLDRSLALVDELEGFDASGNANATTARGQLRDELYQTQAFLQFQDITAQQLSYASSILVEMEERLADLAKSLDPMSSVSPLTLRRHEAHTLAFDPGATVNDADTRQALADAIFTAHD